jgi:hypothetical protein
MIDIKSHGSPFDYDVTDYQGENMPYTGRADDWRCSEAREWKWQLISLGLWAIVIGVAIWGWPW